MEIKLSKHQDAAWDDNARFQVRVWARRSGKTFFTILRQLARIQQEGKGDWQAFYVAPTRIQAAQIAWPYLAQFSAPLGAQLNISDLKCTIPGKGFLQLMNGLQYDRMRGLYADDVTLDEAADIPEAALTEVINPALSDRQGRLTVMGTPKGRMNLLWKMWEMAGRDDAEWSRSLLDWEAAGMVKPEEIERNRRMMSEAQFNQEWLCSWEGATPGAYWGKIMSQLESSGRVTTVAYDDSLPVIASLDLGHHDLMPVVFSQHTGTEHRIIKCQTFQHTGLPDLVNWMRKLPFHVDRMICPHDIRVTELGTGITRLETLRRLGVDVDVAPKLSLDEGIAQTGQFLKHCWFDREATQWLREGLSQYRADYDPVKGVMKLVPVHDKASHYADAMRTLATGNRNMLQGWGEQAAANFGV